MTEAKGVGDKELSRRLQGTGTVLAAAVRLAAAFFAWYGAHLTTPERNGCQGCITRPNRA